MERRASSGGAIAWALALFLIGILGALVTGLTALILWLGAWLGVVGASLVVCLLFVVIATLSYLLTLRNAIRVISDQFETVWRVAELIQEGYDWALRRTSILWQVIERLMEAFFKARH
ncbi:MAG: hypothetical protein IKZ12_00415 [Alistipes sp.]|nr:hypothetical protein [Alistipes sp.]